MPNLHRFPLLKISIPRQPRDGLSAQLISRLEKQGFVVRRADPVDGRSNLIYLTAEGRAIQSALVVLAQENMARAIDGISAADLETAKAVVRKIISNTQR